MSEFLEYDPVTGIKYEVEEHDGKEYMRKTQNLEALVNRNKRMANVGARDSGIKNGWWHVADVPPVIWLEMKKNGYDLFTKDDNEFKKVLQYFEANYPYLKTTHKRIA